MNPVFRSPTIGNPSPFEHASQGCRVVHAGLRALFTPTPPPRRKLHKRARLQACWRSDTLVMLNLLLEQARWNPLVMSNLLQLLRWHLRRTQKAWCRRVRRSGRSLRTCSGNLVPLSTSSLLQGGSSHSSLSTLSLHISLYL